MPAPRLLDKRTVTAELATERKKQIDQGVDLAKKVDLIRATLLEEQEKLERFRTETVRAVQLEIDQLIRKRDSLK